MELELVRELASVVSEAPVVSELVPVLVSELAPLVSELAQPAGKQRQQ